MKTFLLPLLAVLTALTAQAAIKGSPYLPEVDSRFDALERTGAGFAAQSIPGSALVNGSIGDAQIASASVDAIQPERIARFTWNFATASSLGQHAMGITLPPNSVIEKSYFTIDSPISGGNGGAIYSMGCSQNNVYSSYFLSSTAITASTSGAQDGTNTGSAALMRYIASTASSCIVTNAISQAPASSGVATWFIRYGVHN